MGCVTFQPEPLKGFLVYPEYKQSKAQAQPVSRESARIQLWMQMGLKQVTRDQHGWNFLGTGL